MNEWKMNEWGMPISDIKYKLIGRHGIKNDTFKDFQKYIFKTFPEQIAKKMANSFIGDLWCKYNRTNYGFTCQDLETAQNIWTQGLADGKNVIIDNFERVQPPPPLKQFRFCVRRRSGCKQAFSHSEPYTSTITNLNFFFDIPGSHSCDYIFHVLTNLICWANVNIMNISRIHTMHQSDNNVTYMVISQTKFLYCHDVWF